MNDQRARELFLDYHRGSLTAADTAALLTHLAAQPELQREFTEFARTLEALDHMPTPQPSPRLRTRVFAAIEAEKRALRKNYTPAVAPSPPDARRSLLWFWLVA